jgi:LDH2 family malate/lactate/ureidoglycolate dehydrogenase
MLVQAATLENICVQLLLKAGVPPAAARQCADVLLEAELEGTGSHGVIRLPVYLSAIERGQIDPAGAVEIVDTGPGTATVNGGNTLGQVVSVAAMQTAIRKAAETGVASVTARNSNHYGAASYYTRMAARAGMIGISSTNSPKAIPAWGGREAFLGTNPLAIAFPTASDEPLSVDLAMSVVARGKIMQAARANRPIPPGWALDEAGRETTDAGAALAGAMLPLGGPKGFALALAIEILSGVLSGAAFGPHVASIMEQDTDPANVGHWFLALDISRFLPLPVFFSQLEELTAGLKATKLAEGHSLIRMPGERGAGLRRQHLLEGLNLPGETVQALNLWAAKFEVEPLNAR